MLGGRLRLLRIHRPPTSAIPFGAPPATAAFPTGHTSSRRLNHIHLGVLGAHQTLGAALAAHILARALKQLGLRHPHDIALDLDEPRHLLVVGEHSQMGAHMGGGQLDETNVAVLFDLIVRA